MTKKKTTAIKLGPNYSALCNAVEKHDPTAAKWMREEGAKMDCVQGALVWEFDPDDLCDAFTWIDTPQGVLFWNSLDDLVERDRENAKTAAKKKPQPKPLDPLEKLVRDQIDAEYVEARRSLVKEQAAALEAEVAARLAQVQAVIRGELPILTAPDPLTGVPEADSGEALVDRWCVAWDDDTDDFPVIGRVSEHDKDDPANPYHLCVGGEECWRTHASPIERGIPEAIRKVVEG